MTLGIFTLYSNKWKSLTRLGLIVVLGSLGVSKPVHGQMISLPFSGGEYNEADPIHIGIHFTYRVSHYLIAHKTGWETMSAPQPATGRNVNFESITSYPSGHNIGVGIPVDWRVNENLHLMFSPTFYPQFDGMLASEAIYFRYVGVSEPNEKRHRKIGSDAELNHASFDFPLHLKFRSDEKYIDRRAGIGRYKLYMLAGGKFTTNVDNKKFYRGLGPPGDAHLYPLISKSGFPSWEAGAGVDLFFTFFKMSLEARFAQSFGSVLDHESPHALVSPYMAPIEKARLRSFQFTIILE